MSIFGRKNESFYAILKRKIVSAGIFEPPIHGLRAIELSTAKLFDLLLTERKISVQRI